MNEPNLWYVIQNEIASNREDILTARQDLLEV